jgi:membrane fusion protein (multidrug efflux system)
VQLGPDRAALVIPRNLALSDQQGDYVFVVGDDNRAKRRNIRTNDLPENLKEVLSGLSVGEKVVSIGYNKLSDGQVIKTHTEPTITPNNTEKAAPSPMPGSR